MAYSLEACELLTRQIEKLSHLNRHQLAGQLANLEFWKDEVLHGLRLIDEYLGRFERMTAAQKAYVDRHDVIEFDLEETYLRWKASPPVRTDKQEQKEVRQRLVNTWRKFVLRCGKERLLNKTQANDACVALGVSLTPKDLDFGPDS